MTKPAYKFWRMPVGGSQNLSLIYPIPIGPVQPLERKQEPLPNVRLVFQPMPGRKRFGTQRLLIDMRLTPSLTLGNTVAKGRPPFEPIPVESLSIIGDWTQQLISSGIRQHYQPPEKPTLRIWSVIGLFSRVLLLAKRGTSFLAGLSRRLRAQRTPQ